MKIEELFKFELGMGIQNGQNRIGGRPEPQKKNGNFHNGRCWWLHCAACTWASRLSHFESIPASQLRYFRNSVRFQPVCSAMSNRFRKKMNLRDQRRSSLMNGAAVPFSWSIVSMRWQLMLTGISGCRSIASWWSERCSCSISTLCGSDEWFGASWLFELGSSTLLIHSIIHTSK